MCLILYKHSIKTITHTDIVVYKVVIKVVEKSIRSFFGITQPKTIYRSLYYSFDYLTDLTYCSLLSLSHSPSGKRTIENGFHSYADLEDAKYNKLPRGVVVKCIIPAGAEFYEGYGLDGTPQYASDKIIIKEEVKL